MTPTRTVTSSRMSQTELQGQITSQDDSNEDGESFHIEASEAPLGINAAVPPPPATFADGLQLHLNPRSKSGYTRVEALPDGRFRVSVDNAAQIGLLETCMMMPHDDAVDMHDSKTCMMNARCFACAGARRRAHRAATRHLLDGSRGRDGLRSLCTNARATSGPGDGPGDGRGVAVCCGVLDGVA